MGNGRNVGREEHPRVEGSSSERKSVTLTVQGSAALSVLIPGNQELQHDGVHVTLWHGVLSTLEAEEVVGLLRLMRLDVTVGGVDPFEGDGERTEHHTIPGDGVGTLPTLACPKCAWLDYTEAGFLCGIEAWHPAVSSVFNVGKAAEDLAACPAGRIL